MKAYFEAVIGKIGYEKWKVNEPGVFYFLFYVRSREIPKKPFAGVARKQSRCRVVHTEFCLVTGIIFHIRIFILQVINLLCRFPSPILEK